MKKKVMSPINSIRHFISSFIWILATNSNDDLFTRMASEDSLVTTSTKPIPHYTPHIVLLMGFSVYIIIIEQKNHKLQLIFFAKLRIEIDLIMMKWFHFFNSHRDRFPFYKSNDDRWKNSVRHNLSINPHFRKGNKPAQGAGHLWIISTRDSEANLLAWEHVSILVLYWYRHRWRLFQFSFQRIFNFVHSLFQSFILSFYLHFFISSNIIIIKIYRLMIHRNFLIFLEKL